MLTPTYRVSNIAAYVRWKNEDTDDISWLYKSVFDSQPTEPMRRGTAFHSALEKIGTGEFSTVSADGYTFAFTCDAEVVLPKTREIRMSKDYGGIVVTGKCDGISGRIIDDHKTVSQFDAPHLLEGCQQNFYMDIFDADVFRWHCWEMKERKVDIPYPNFQGEIAQYYAEREWENMQEEEFYEVFAYHPLTQYRYPQMEEDCRALAHEFRDFAARLGWGSPRIK